MSLTSVELDRVRYELGFPLTRIGAEPYVTFAAVFSRAIAPYLIDYGSTSTTTVAAATGGANVAVTVAANPVVPDPYNAAGFVVGAQVVVDVGPAQEFSVIQVVSGLALTMNLSNAHGTGAVQYPVILKGAEWIVRDIISRIDVINTQLATVAPQAAGVEQVDEVKLAVVRGRGQRAMIDDLVFQRGVARSDLADAIGVPNLRDARRGGNNRVVLY